VLQGLLASASGMEAQVARLGVLADDVANLGTAGFKAVDVQQRESGGEAVLGPAAPSGQLTRAAGVVLGPSWRDWSEGPIRETGRRLDVAIEGPGFFQVQLAGGGVGLTRAGAFGLDAAGNLVDAHGDRVLGVGGQPITFPASSGEIAIAADGSVTVSLPGGKTQKVGQIALALPARPDGLAGGPAGSWIATAASGPTATGSPGSSGFGSLQQGALEASNADLASIAVSMVLAQQAYTLNAQAVNTAAQMWALADQLQA
jgi:flagellar basal-body rod protein FlgG